MSVVLLCLLAVHDNPFAHEKPAILLGEARSRFRGQMGGDMPFGNLPPEFYFPAGKAKERFVLFGREGARKLEFEVQLQGNPTVMWSAPLDQFADMAIPNFVDYRTNKPIPLPIAMSSRGSMVKLLWRLGYKLREPVNLQVAKRLKVQEGYAGYGMLTYFSELGTLQTQLHSV